MTPIKPPTKTTIAAMAGLVMWCASVAAQGGAPPQGPPPGQQPRRPRRRPRRRAQEPPGPQGRLPDQLRLTMQYIAASLGVQCNYCHVQGQNDLDDKETKRTAREMMKMVADQRQLLRRQEPGQLRLVPQRPLKALRSPRRWRSK